MISVKSYNSEIHTSDNGTAYVWVELGNLEELIKRTNYEDDYEDIPSFIIKINTDNEFVSAYLFSEFDGEFECKLSDDEIKTLNKDVLSNIARCVLCHDAIDICSCGIFCDEHIFDEYHLVEKIWNDKIIYDYSDANYDIVNPIQRQHFIDKIKKNLKTKTFDSEMTNDELYQLLIKIGEDDYL